MAEDTTPIPPESPTPPPPHTPPERRRSPRWVKVLLGLSLALNLAIVSLAAGAMLRVKKGGGAPPRGLAYLSALESDDRRAVIKGARDAARGAPGAGRADMQQALTLLRAQSFDAEAFSDLLEAQSARNATFQDSVRDSLMTRLSGMDPAARQAYADRLEARLKRNGKKKPKPRP